MSRLNTEFAPARAEKSEQREDDWQVLCGGSEAQATESGCSALKRSKLLSARLKREQG